MSKAARNGAATAGPGGASGTGEEGPANLPDLPNLSEMGAHITHWRDDLVAQIKRRPARSLLVAVGAGYLVGGGIGTILTARLLALGARMAVRLAVIPIFADGIERALFENRAEAPAEAKLPNPKQLTHQKEIDS